MINMKESLNHTREKTDVGTEDAIALFIVKEHFEKLMMENLTNIPANLSGTRDNSSVPIECTDIFCRPDEEYLDYLEDYVFPDDWEWGIIILYALTFIVGLSGNVLVCFAVWRNRSMRTVTNIFIVNLAIADLAVIIICLPPTLLSDVTETWYFGFAMCKIALFLQTTSVAVSVFTLSAISVERWYAICYPLRFKSTKRRAKIIIFVIWIIAFLLALPEVIVADLTRFVKRQYIDLLIFCGPQWSDKTNQVVYQSVIIVLMYLLPLVLMTVTYSMIAVVLWTGKIPGAIESANRPMMDGNVNRAEEQLESRKKAAKMLITVVIGFAVCYFPVHLFNILRYADALRFVAPRMIQVLSMISHWLPYLNSSINPIIYNFMSAKFRKEFTAACCCTKRRRAFSVHYKSGVSTFSCASQYTHRNNSNSCTEQVLLSTYPDH